LLRLGGGGRPPLKYAPANFESLGIAQMWGQQRLYDWR